MLLCTTVSREHVVDEIHVVFHCVLNKVNFAREALNIQHCTMMIEIWMMLAVHVFWHICNILPLVCIFNDRDVSECLALIEVLKNVLLNVYEGPVFMIGAEVEAFMKFIPIAKLVICLVLEVHDYVFIVIG